jgi:hypothetical protein
LDNIDCLSLSGFKLDNPGHLKFLERAIESKGYKLVVLDNWTDLVSKVDENKAVEVSSVLSALRRIADKHGCAFILLHHLRKNPPFLVSEIDEPRGSSALINEADLVYLVQVDEATGHRIVKMIKNRHGGRLAFRLAFDEKDGKLAIRWAGEVEEGKTEATVVKCARAIMDYLASREGMAERKEIVKAMEAIGFPRATIDRALKYGDAMGFLERPKRGVYSLKSASPNFSTFSTYNSSEKVEKSEKTGVCIVCGKPDGKPRVTDKGVVYLHEECESKYEGKL